VSEKKDKFSDAYKNAREHILTGKAYNHLKKIQSYE
jgi:anthranilate phosphoribosyltransferase